MAKKGLIKEKDLMDPESNSGIGKAIRQSKLFKDLMKKIREGIQKAIKKLFEAIGKLITSTLPYSLIVIAIIIVLLLFVSLIQAFFNLPGDMQARLKAFFDKAFEGWHFANGAVTKLSEDYQDIIDVVNYLEDMEYDVISYGFVKPDLDTGKKYTVDELLSMGYAYNNYEYMEEQGFTYENTDEIYHLFNMETGELYQGTYYNSLGIPLSNATNDRVINDNTYTDNFGMVRSTDEYNENGKGKLVKLTESNDSGKIKDIARRNYGLIRTYLLSDYRIYSLRNYDETLMTNIYNAMSATFGGNQDAWSRGLIMLYNAVDGIATSNWTAWDRIVGGDSAHITRTSLELKDGYFNRSMSYEIEGWAPRYGLSLEFLLSLHLGTMAPDLVYAMLQNFDTEIQVYLNDSGSSTVSATYVELDKEQNVSDKEVTLDIIKSTLEATGHDIIAANIQLGDNGALQWLGTVTLTRDGVGDLFRSDIGLSSPWNCTGAATSYTIIDEATSEGQKVIEYPGFWDFMGGIFEDVEYYELGENVDLLQVLYNYNDPDLAEIDYDKKIDAYNNEYIKFNRSTALKSYKLDNGLDYDTQIDYVTSSNVAFDSRKNSQNYLIEHYGLPTKTDEHNNTVPDMDYSRTNTIETINYNKCFDIIENKVGKDWSVFLDENGNVIDEATFLENGETSNESDIRFQSYIYIVYETGIVDPNGNIIKYGEDTDTQEEPPEKMLIKSFAYNELATAGLEIGEEPDPSKTIKHSVYVYYDLNSEFHYTIEDVVTGGASTTSKIKWVPFMGNFGRDADIAVNYYMTTEDEDTTYAEWESFGPNPTIAIDEHTSENLCTVVVYNMNGGSDDDGNHGYKYPGCELKDFEYSMEGVTVINEDISEIIAATEQGHSVMQQERMLKDVLYINVAVRDKTIEEKIKAGLLNEDGTLKEGEGDCYGQCLTDPDFKPCRACVNYVDKAITALQEVSDQDFKFYTPYIARVVGSWFRNVYFVIPGEVGERGEDSSQEDIAIYEYASKHKEYNKNEAYGNNTKFVKVDQEYLADSGEYWTAYVMKIDPDTNEETNEYQLFVLKPTGITSNTTMEDFLSNGKIDGEQAYKNGVAVTGYESQKEAENDGWAFVKKAKSMTIDEIKADSTNTAAYPSGILWSAYVFDTDGNLRNRERVLYSEGNNEVNAVYDIIYHVEPGTVDEPTGEEPESETSNVDTNRANDPNEASGYFYEIEHSNNVTQEEDAQRAETNPLVKYLFKYRQFYIYDGVEKTALAIEHDKYRVLHGYRAYIDKNIDSTNEYYASKKLVKEQYKEIETLGYSNISIDGEFYHYKGLLSSEDSGTQGLLLGYYGDNWKTIVKDLLNHYGRSAIRDSYTFASFSTVEEDLANQWLDWQLDMYYMNKYGVDLYQYYKTTVNEVKSLCNNQTDKLLLLEVDPRDPDLIGTVNIVKSSLSSFSILENVGTLDAEYQYRDFKELIVELNYFDKEDLSEKIPEIFTWVLPQISPAGWPVLPFDKQDINYGTLIHSNKTYLGLSDYTGIPLGLGNIVQGSVDSLDGFLFIGDSRVLVQKSKIEELGEGVIAIGVGASSPSMWVNVTDPSSSGVEVMPEGSGTHRVELPDASQVKGVYMMHGVNGPTQIEDMKKVLENLHARYPNVPFFMASAIHVGSVQAGFWYEPPEHNRLIDVFNSTMKSYCDANTWITYVDIQDGLYDANGYLKHEYANDYVHIYPGQSPEGTEVYINNIKKSVLGNNNSSSSSTTSSNQSIDESKLYWIGDSWTVGLVQYGIMDGTVSGREVINDRTLAKIGASAYSLPGTPNPPSDTSGIIVALGKNDPFDPGINAIIDLVNNLQSSHPNIPVYILKLSYYGTNPYVDGSQVITKSDVDTFNQKMQEYCSGKENVSLIDPNGSINDEEVIKSQYNVSDNIHLNSEGYKEWYNGIISAVKGGSNNSSQNNSAAYFSGYEAGQKVTSPVTGKIIEYGIHTRKNCYTLEDEEVGFITIEIMTGDYFKPDMIPADIEYESSISDEYEGKENYDSADEALNLFYKEYERVCAGFRVTIDGFDVDLSIEGGEYEQNEVAVLYNTKEQAKREAMEQAKDDAPFMINNSGLSELPSFEEGYHLEDEDSLQAIFIKEGKFIGITTEPTGDNAEADPENPEDPEEPAAPEETEEPSNSPEDEDNMDWGNFDYSNYKGPTDYMRIIMKDLDYSLVENVEKYFDIPELGETNTQSSGELGVDMEVLFFTVFEGGPWETWPADSWFRTVSGGDGSLTCVTNLKPSSANFEVGIIQWTSNSSLTNIQEFCRVAAERNPTLFGRLARYQSMDSTTLRERSNKDALLQDMLDISHEDWDALAAFEIEYAKEGYLQPCLDRYPWLAQRRGVVQGSVMSIQVLHGVLADNAAGTLTEGMTDKEIIEKCRQAMIGFGDEYAPRANQQSEFANKVVDGLISDEQIIQFIKTGSY